MDANSSRRGSRSGETMGSRWRMPILMLWGALAMSFWNVQDSPTGALWASDDDDDTTEEEVAESIGTVIVDMDETEVVLVLWDDQTVTLETTESYGTWSLPPEPGDYTIATESSSLLLTGLALSPEGGSGVATMTTTTGSTVEGTWTLSDIHPVEVGNLLYNLEYVDDTTLTGNFTSILVDGEWRDVSVGEGNTVEIVSSLGNRIIHLSDGCQVFIGNADTSMSGLAIQDPEQNKIRREPDNLIWVAISSSVRRYPRGEWIEVTEAQKGCFQDSLFGRNCGAPVQACAVAVTTVAPDGSLRMTEHQGSCSKESNYYLVNATGALFVTATW